MVTFLAREKQNAGSYTLAWWRLGKQELQVYRLATQTLRRRNSHKEVDSGSTQYLFDSDQQRTAPCTAYACNFDNQPASAERWTERLPRSPRLRNELQNRSHRKAEIAVF